MCLLLLGVLLASALAAEEAAKGDAKGGTAAAKKEKEKDKPKNNGINCDNGLVIPLWPGTEHMTMGDRFGRGILYAVLMLYLFIGVAIVSDKFMESIEMITAQEKEISVKDPRSGKTQVIIVKVWNETVANLTLMALGSSAPEIMLSVIEIWAKDFKAGDLGPGTIVGSAAFNLFMIIGLCMYVIPDDEVRKIKHLRVFLVTATWSVFAYIWLYVILGAISYGEVNTWEGILTFLFFPATVWTAWWPRGVCFAINGSQKLKKLVLFLSPLENLTWKLVLTRNSRTSTMTWTQLWLNLSAIVASTSMP